MDPLASNAALPAGPLIEMLARVPFTTHSIVGVETIAALDLVLVVDGIDVRLRITPRTEARAFARTRSLAIAHLDPALGPEILAGVAAFAKALARIDPGGVEVPALARTNVRLAVLETVPGGSWSRATFDDRLAAVQARGERYATAVLVVTQACRMACTFCPSRDKQHQVVAEGGVDRHLEDLIHQLEAGRSLGARALDIGGNDVLRFAHVLDVIEAAHRLGYEHQVVQSPGQALADRAFAERIAASPLDAIDVPIYGADAASHDAVTGTPGSFDDLVRAIDVVSSLGRPAIRLKTLVLRSTASQLASLLAFTEARFGLRTHIGALRPNRVGERDHLSNAPTFSELAELVRPFADRFETDGPLCVLPPDRAHALGLALAAAPRRVHLWDLGIRDGSEDDRVKRDRERTFPSVCAACSARGTCAGVLRGDLDALGTEGLRPLPPTHA